MENLITGAEALMRSLEHQGVKTIFGYPGGSIMDANQEDERASLLLSLHQPSGLLRDSALSDSGRGVIFHG